MMSADQTPSYIAWGGADLWETRMKDHQHKPEAAHLCDRCNRELAYTNEMLSERMDLWISAYNLLSAREWKGDSNDPTPMDVEALAVFLAGENT